MVQPFLDTFPDVSVGYLGLERDHETAVARNYYCKLPPLAGRRVFLVDPMLATGNSAAAAISRIKSVSPLSIKFVCLIASPEGLEIFADAHPDVHVYTAAIDEKLNEHGYIVPGLGDAGDRIYGTK
jgi:uracil phosphoribosyltransferase